MPPIEQTVEQTEPRYNALLGPQEQAPVALPSKGVFGPKWVKGQSGNPSGRPKGPQRRTLKQLGRSLMDQVEHELARNGGKKLTELAVAIVEGAIQREPSCLAFIGPRFAPILEQATSGKTIIQGIRLEVTTGEAQAASLTITQGVASEASGEEALGSGQALLPGEACSTSPALSVSDVNGES